MDSKNYKIEVILDFKTFIQSLNLLIIKDEAMNVVKNLDLRNSAEYDEFCHPPVYDRVLHPGDLGRLYQDLELEEVGEMRLTDLIDNFKTRLKKENPIT